MRLLAIGPTAFVSAALVSAALVLGACSKPAPPPPPPAPAPPPPPAHLPAPKAGLWHTVTTTKGSKPAPSQLCMDGKPFDPNHDEPGCGAFSITREASGAYVIDGTCKLNGVNSKVHVVTRGDYGHAWSSDTTTTLTNAGEPDVVTQTHTAWTYAGPTCPTS